MTDQVQLYEAVENVAKSFEAFKETNDKMLEEERKGNESRAKELAEQLEKISSNLTENQKKRDILQKKLDMQSDRLEMLEALQDRPKATIQERIHSEHKELFMKWIRRTGSVTKWACESISTCSIRRVSLPTPGASLRTIRSSASW